MRRRVRAAAERRQRDRHGKVPPCGAPRYGRAAPRFAAGLQQRHDFGHRLGQPRIASSRTRSGAPRSDRRRTVPPSVTLRSTGSRLWAPVRSPPPRRRSARRGRFASDAARASFRHAEGRWEGCTGSTGYRTSGAMIRRCAPAPRGKSAADVPTRPQPPAPQQGGNATQAAIRRSRHAERLIADFFRAWRNRRPAR